MLRATAGQYFHVIAFNADGRVSGDALNITCNLSMDNAAAVGTNDTNPDEIGTTGEYIFGLTQAETDCHEQSFRPESSTPGVQVVGVPSNVIWTIEDLSPTYVIPQTVIDTVTVPVGSLAVYRGSQWTITLEGVPDDEYANTSYVYFGMKSSDVADTASAIQIRWTKSGATTACTYINGTAAAGGQITQAVVTHSTYDPGDASTAHRYILVVEGELTALVPTTNSLNGTDSLNTTNAGFGYNRIQYTGEWKITGATEMVIGAATIVVLPGIVRATD